MLILFLNYNLAFHFLIVIGDLRVFNRSTARRVKFERIFRARKGACVDENALPMCSLKISAIVSNNDEVRQWIEAQSGIKVPIGWKDKLREWRQTSLTHESSSELLRGSF